MSASERLRALEPIYITIAELGEIEHTLYDVPLPLIADVIEAAEAECAPKERSPDKGAAYWAAQPDHPIPGVQRRIVLARALTALQAHLTPEHPGPCDEFPIKDWGS